MKHQIRRRIVPFALAAVLGIQPVMAAPYRLSVPSGYTSPFVDVQGGDWYYKYVAVLNSQGMIDGYGDGQFGPNDALTSGAALVMVLKAAGSGAITPSGAHWASGYADYAVEKGYLTREEIGDLDAPIRRELIAQLAARALKLEPSQGKSPFADVDDGELTALYELGIITGSQEEGKTVFLPDKPITRAEISVIVWQVDRVHRYGKQIPFQGAYYDILPDVPVNSYDPEGFGRKNGVMYYKENGVDVARGVDVSVHQGEIDWTKVADAGIEFAMIRVGYRGYSQGALQMDERFRENMDGALAAGLDVGVYFFSQATSVLEAEEEADFVLSAIRGYPIKYPVAFDWEFIDGAEARTNGMDGDTVTQCATAFCDLISVAGYTPMVYFNQELGYLFYQLDQLDASQFWLAEYDTKPDFFYDFEMWQYTHTGAVPGIQGNVDLNLAFRRT